MTQQLSRALPRRTPVFSPQALASILRLPEPTEQQSRIIAAGMEPLLVVAGAGSGKTETMAARVVYLVANGFVRPEQVLGLTFTRKAAGELTRRIRERLGQLARSPDFADRRGEGLLGEPTVLTYHAYAARVAAEHGLRAGFEPSTRLLTEAACWQLADSVVRSYEGDMSYVDLSPATVTRVVLELAGDLAEHLRTTEELADFTERFCAEVEERDGTLYRKVADVLARQRARAQILPLVEAYNARKRAMEAMDFADQMARAALLARDHPAVGAIERDRYRVVLLDEYQDTSHAQVVLLRSLFGGGHPVTAVGDPCQSIYAWRGASADTLRRFPEDFPSGSGVPAPVLPLTVSWRNRPEILRVANGISQPLRDQGHQVGELRSPPGRPPVTGPVVRVALHATVTDEAEWIAERIEEAWRQARRRSGAPVGTDEANTPPPPTTAVLVRGRRQIPPLQAALRARGLPVEVVGLGGLLDTPEVREIVSTLQVLADPTAGAALQRLLTGPRWRLGPRDLVALYRRSRQLAKQRRRDTDQEAVPHRLDEATLTEALDDLGPPEEYSVEGYRRLSALARELRGLWSRMDQSLPDLIADVERTLGLDVEVAVRPGQAAALARGHLDAFADVAAQFAAEAEAPTLSSFLAFLDAAERSERGLEPGHVEVTEGAVQVLTIHAAKGLEWDIVAVAGMSDGVFPPRQTTSHWLTQPGTLPFPLRGDAAGLPELSLEQARDQREIRDAVEEFEQRWREHDRREERRLAYVAVTRPRRLLLCSGYWWDGVARRPRGPSEFLSEVRDHCLAGAGQVDVWVPEPDKNAQNPMLAHPPRAVWPQDPLGERRGELEAAAALVHSELNLLLGNHGALSQRYGPDSPNHPREPQGDGPQENPQEEAARQAEEEEARRWAYEVDLLLAERARKRPGPMQVGIPQQLTVSQLVRLRQDPEQLARHIRRPLPMPPAPHTRRGTAFHQWLERRWGAQWLVDIDDLPGAADEGAAGDEQLEALQAAFLASPWATRVPVRVEVPFLTVLSGVVVRGRMDAVFATDDGGYEVIDWKTGVLPDAEELKAAAVQLAVYRLAWAELAGVSPDRVRAGFHYVREGITVWPDELPDMRELEALVGGIPVVPVAEPPSPDAAGE